MRHETAVSLTSEWNATLACKELLLLELRRKNFALLFYIGNHSTSFMQLMKLFA